MTSLNIKSKINIRVYYEDTDIGGVVYHSKYLNFAERGRAELLRKLSLEQTLIKDIYNIQFVVKELSINYLGYCSLDDDVLLETSLTSLNRAKLTFNHLFYKKNKKITNVLVDLCCVNNTGKVARMPKSLYHKIIN